MNDMELLRELAKETPLPAPAELDAARARLVAAIAADPAAGRVAAGAAAATHQPYPSSGQPVELVRPPAPAPVLTAVKFMYSGAAGAAAYLIIALFFSFDIKDYHLRMLGHRLTTAQLSHLQPLILTLAIVIGLALIALWLWMARAVGQGRNWARILSAVLFVLATLELQGEHGLLSVFLAWVTWLTGLAVVWLLWRPASRGFFKKYPVHADYAGITLGRQRYPLTSRPALFVPWADVEQIILYTGHQGGGPAPWIGIRCREGAAALPSGNEQDPFCPVPGVAAWATRRIKGGRLDHGRLAAVTAAVAPGISVIEASAGPGPGVAGPGRSASAPEGPD
jgi:hypothetical protein